MEKKKTPSMSSGHRGRINVVNIVVTCTVVFLMSQISNGEFVSGIHRMTKDLNRALLEALDGIDDVVYTEFIPNKNFGSSVEFDSRGMAVLYNITNTVMHWIIPDVSPIDYIEIHDSKISIVNDDIAALVAHYKYFIAFISALLVFAMLMPLCGFCFCCCRCCGNCGAKPEQFDKKKDLCKKVTCGTLLIAIGTLFLFGVVCAFVTNEHLQDGTNDLTANLRVNLDDTNLYINDTKKHINILLDTNFDEFSKVLKKTLKTTSTILIDELKNLSKATSMDNAIEIVSYMTPLHNNLTDIKLRTRTLRVEASQLNDAMRKIKRDLLEQLKVCEDIPQCSKLKEEYVNKLGTDIDFNSIPDITNEIGEVDEILKSPIQQNIENGLNQIKNIEAKMNSSISSNINEVSRAIDETGLSIKEKSKDVMKTIDDIVVIINRNSYEGLDTANKYIKEYSKYRYYIGLVVACILLTITLCIVLGLICGVCGKRPDSYGDDCCNKGTGSRFLICGVSIMFLTGLLLVVILLIHVVGMFAHLIICEPIRDPSNSKTIKFIDKVFSLNDMIKIDVTIESVLTGCYANKSAYNVFNLKQQIDLAEINNTIEELEIDKKLESLQDQIRKIDFSSIVLLNDTSLKDLEKLKETGLSKINFDKIRDELNVSFTTVNFDAFSEQFGSLIDFLNGQKINVSDLKKTQKHIEKYIDEIYNPMRENADKIINMSLSIQDNLKFGHSTFEEAIGILIKDIKEAQDMLSSNGTEQLANLTKTFSDSLLKQMYSYLDRVIFNFTYSVGNCGSLALIMNSTMTSTCDKILAPMNGFWFSILWCLILFIPAIIISVKLSSLYQKFDYQNAYVESEYLYDAYADRENIPLARGKHNKKKSKKRRSERYISETMEPGREYPGGSHHPDTRYADMAPKHFEDYPNGGPPHYQRSTEYERPPPYYYPGSGDH